MVTRLSKYFGMGALIIVVTAPHAFAEDRPDIREVIECMPAKEIVKLLSKFEKMDADKRDTVDALLSAKFKAEEGQSMPDRMFMRYGDFETALTIEPGGDVPDFGLMGTAPQDGEICVEDQARSGLSRKEDGLSFGVDFDIQFKDVTGPYNLETLRDGAKDGKSFYKKLVPAPIRLLIPKMTHLSVTFDDPEAAGQKIGIFAGETLIDGLTIEPFGGSHIFEIDQIEDLGADTLVISGGSFILEPTPSIKKLKKLGFTPDNETETEEGPEK